MNYTPIITPSHLDDFSGTRLSEEEIPKLINLLIHVSVNDLKHFRMPHGESIRLPGYDGIVSTENGYGPYVPQGNSVWEIGTDKNPISKARKDLVKRSLDPNTPDELNSNQHLFS